MSNRYELITLAGKTTTKHWILDIEKDEVHSTWNTRAIAERELEILNLKASRQASLTTRVLTVIDSSKPDTIQQIELS